MRDDDRERFYDLCYEAWCRGVNPDYVNYDNYDYCRSQGYYPEEIGLDMIYKQRKIEEDEYYYQQEMVS